MTVRSACAVSLALLLACSMGWDRRAAAAVSDSGRVAAADEAAIRSAIAAQLQAFRQDDADGAFRIASPQIEQRYGDAATFLAAVKVGYPAVYRARDVSYGPIIRQDGAILQQVGLVGPDGTGAVALYTMEREANGTWRIDGCTLTAGGGEGA